MPVLVHDGIMSLFHSLFSTPCTLGALATACLMSIRDMRTREVVLHELALFFAFAFIRRALWSPLPPDLARLPAELLSLFAGALLMLVIRILGWLAARRCLIGTGDILFACAAGFMLPPGRSLAMTCLAFFLALPFSLARLAAREPGASLPFIPFLSLAALLLCSLPASFAIF